jgi:hypothetical protein
LRPKLPKLANFLDEAETDVLAYMTFPAAHRVKLHSTDEMDKRFFGTSNELEESGVSPFFRSTAPPPFFRPDHDLAGRRAQGQSRLAAFAATGRLGLEWPERGGILDQM